MPLCISCGSLPCLCPPLRQEDEDSSRYTHPSWWWNLPAQNWWRRTDGLLVQAVGYPQHFLVHQAGVASVDRVFGLDGDPKILLPMIDEIYPTKSSSKMTYAVAEAEGSRGLTSPNPAVGAIIVANGAVIASGSTEPPPGRHAEVVAIEAAKQSGRVLSGAWLYTTLEPCCHYGRTPPCTGVILSEPWIQCVIVGCYDPSPEMDGRGVEKLREAGLTVVVGVCGIQCRNQMTEFFDRISKEKSKG